MSDTSRTGLYFVEESTWGTTPASALVELRKTSMNFRPIIAKTESPEIINDAQVLDLILTDQAAEGEMDFALHYGAYDKFLEGLVRSAFPGSPVTITAATISAASADNSFNDSGNGFVTAGFIAGQMIKTSGFSNSANNGYFVVSSVTAGKIIVTGGTLVVEAAGSRTIKGTPITNGTTKKSYSIEDTFTNTAGTTHYIGYTGMRVGGASLSLAPGSIATGSFSFMGKRGVSSAATIGTGAATAAATTPVMNSIGDVKFIQEGGTAIELTNLSLNFDNGLRTRGAIGTLGATGIGQGQFRVTGSLSLYMENRTLFDKAVNQTESSIAWVVEDSAGNAYGIHIPALEYGQPDKPVSAPNADLVLTMPFTAKKHSTLAKTIYITRFPA